MCGLLTLGLQPTTAPSASTPGQGGKVLTPVQLEARMRKVGLAAPSAVSSFCIRL